MGAIAAASAGRMSGKCYAEGCTIKVTIFLGGPGKDGGVEKDAAGI